MAIWLLLLQSVLSLAADPDAAYAALKAHDYDAAISYFRKALTLDPTQNKLRQDLAYTLLKTGDTEEARDQFAIVLKADAGNEHLTLEYAYLCYETRKPIDARRAFARLSLEGKDPKIREAAAAAFRNVDVPLAAGIDRWRQAVTVTPNAFSAHQELAQLAEQRDELTLAAQHYEYAWRLRRDMRSFLLDLGRVWRELDRGEDANAALLAASRGAEPRAAHKARALLPSRYPYVYEFQNALKLDGENLPLRREYAYLLLEMGRKQEAEAEFRLITELTPKDRTSAAQLGFLWLTQQELSGQAAPLLNRVLEGDDDELSDRVRTTLQLPQTLRRRPETPEAKVHNEARLLAKKSLDAGYLKDAIRYLEVAHETDPIDFGVMLQLGWTNNVLKNDRAAVKWFSLARNNPDPKQAAEADRAFRNLAPQLKRLHTSTWIYPFFSSRWRNLFGYGQVKTEFNLGKAPVRPYFTTRFVGDLRRQIRPQGNLPPQYLSESSFIFALGLRTLVWKGAMAWGEAGQALRYLGRGANTGLFTPDYRGGVSMSRSFGRNLGNTKPGWFLESANDFVFVSRFDRDFLLYSQNKTGYTFARAEDSGFQLQSFFNWNLTADVKRFAWANFAEAGPGVRFRFNGLPPSMFFIVQGVRGRHFLDMPQGRYFNDLRAGFWYAFAR
jgi:Flp pilus assembly protein TadD